MRLIIVTIIGVMFGFFKGRLVCGWQRDRNMVVFSAVGITKLHFPCQNMQCLGKFDEVYLAAWPWNGGMAVLLSRMNSSDAEFCKTPAYMFLFLCRQVVVSEIL